MIHTATSISSPLFSVLVANYNNSRFLAQCLNSVLKQTYKRWEIVLVDDGSSDEFESVISPYRSDPRIRIYRNDQNMGCAFTKQRLALLGMGSVMGFLDPDDALHPFALEILQEAHDAHPECSIIHSTHFVCDASMRSLHVADYPKALPPKTPYLLLNDGSIHAFASFKRAAYEQSEGLSNDRSLDKAIDQELYYLLEEHGSVLFINEPLYYYRIHQGSISNLGNEFAATNVHYTIVEQQLRKRIGLLRDRGLPDRDDMLKRYLTRLHKVRILHRFRIRDWPGFLVSVCIFPFVGGRSNLVSYLKKIPKEGFSIVRRSFGQYNILEKKTNLPG